MTARMRSGDGSLYSLAVVESLAAGGGRGGLTAGVSRVGEGDLADEIGLASGGGGGGRAVLAAGVGRYGLATGVQTTRRWTGDGNAPTTASTKFLTMASLRSWSLKRRSHAASHVDGLRETGSMIRGKVTDPTVLNAALQMLDDLSMSRSNNAGVWEAQCTARMLLVAPRCLHCMCFGGLLLRGCTERKCCWGCPVLHSTRCNFTAPCHRRGIWIRVDGDEVEWAAGDTLLSLESETLQPPLEETPLTNLG